MTWDRGVIVLTRMLTWTMRRETAATGDARDDDAQDGTIKSFGKGILNEAEAKKKNEKSRQKSAIEIMADHEREKQRAKEERRATKEAKKQARLEKEEFERTGGQVKLSKKERRRLEAME